MRRTLRGVKHGSGVWEEQVWERERCRFEPCWRWELRGGDGLVSATGVEPMKDMAEAALQAAIGGRRIDMERWQLGTRVWIERGEDGEWGWSWEIRGAYGAVLMSGRCVERAEAEAELAAGVVEVMGW